MFFKKKESDQEYLGLKKQVLDERTNLLNGNPFEEPDVMRDKWSEEIEQLKKLYKLSKKYSDTVADTEQFKGYIEEAKKFQEKFSYEADLKNYKNDLKQIKLNFDTLDEGKYDIEIVNNTEESYENWNNMYISTKKLVENVNKYINDAEEKDNILKMHTQSKYYYAFYSMRKYYLEIHSDAKREIIRKQECLKKCIDLTKNNKDDLKFELLCGNAYYLLSNTWDDFAYLNGMDESWALSKFKEDRNNARYRLNKLEGDTKKYICSIPYNIIEWNMYTEAFFNLASYYIFFTKNHSKAHDLIEKELEKLDLVSSISGNCKAFSGKLQEHLARFKKGLLGWKYEE